MAFDPNPTGVAYLVVGSTGTGKSSLINLFTNNQATVGHGAESGTKSTHGYQPINSKDIWIDTVGIEDPEGMTDEQIIIDTLKYLQKNSIEHVTIVWIINPTLRKTQPLQKQAKYIDSLRPKEIWDSVILIVKQASALEQDALGALEAAKEYHNGASNIPVTTYNCVDWLQGQALVMYQSLLKIPGSAEVLKSLSYINGNEVKVHVQDTLFKLKNASCQVIFCDSKCKKCGVIGDERIMPEKCHVVMTKKHEEGAILDKKHEHTGTPFTVVKDKKINKFHTGSVEWFHTGGFSESYRYLISHNWWWDRKSGYRCCGQDKGSIGCKQRYICCGADQNSPGCNTEIIEIKETFMSCCELSPEAECGRVTDYWTCCEGDADAEGCVEVCQLCEKPWKNDEYPGCVSITQSKHECEKI